MHQNNYKNCQNIDDNIIKSKAQSNSALTKLFARIIIQPETEMMQESREKKIFSYSFILMVDKCKLFAHKRSYIRVDIHTHTQYDDDDD